MGYNDNSVTVDRAKHSGVSLEDMLDKKIAQIREIQALLKDITESFEQAVAEEKRYYYAQQIILKQVLDILEADHG